MYCEGKFDRQMQAFRGNFCALFRQTLER